MHLQNHIVVEAAEGIEKAAEWGILRGLAVVREAILILLVLAVVKEVISIPLVLVVVKGAISIPLVLVVAREQIHPVFRGRVKKVKARDRVKVVVE